MRLAISRSPDGPGRLALGCVRLLLLAALLRLPAALLMPLAPAGSLAARAVGSAAAGAAEIGALAPAAGAGGRAGVGGSEPAAAASGQRLDDFEDLAGWSATASPGASIELAHDAGREGLALRIDFDLGAGGWAIARRALPIALPEDYALSFDVRGQGAANDLEIKLVDPRGDDVWRAIERGFEPPESWRRHVVKRSRLRFAWGSSGGKPLERLGFLEIAIVAGSGGRGSLWIDDLRLAERRAPGPVPPRPQAAASTSAPGNAPEAALDDDPRSAWRSGEVAEPQWLQVDLGEQRELGGLVIDWDPEDYALAYEVQLSDDAETWSTAYASTGGHDGRDYVYLHDAEARWVRLALERSSRGRGYAIRELRLKPPSFSASPNDFFAAIAAEARPGLYPKYLLGRQSYWTVVGVAGDDAEALMNEEGALEVGHGAFSIEPFLVADGELVTWHDVRTGQELEQGDLPVPTVTWEGDGLALRVTALATGEPEASLLLARYRVENPGAARRELRLLLAVRPFQVLPPWQMLNGVGGATHVRTLGFASGTVWVDGERPVVSLTAADGFGAASFAQDLPGTHLARGRLPVQDSASDAFGYASGALEYRLEIEPHGHADVIVAVPFHPPAGSAALAAVERPERYFEEQLEAAVRGWRRDLGRVELLVPPEDAALVRAVTSTLAYVQINRDGPRIQPGSRTYARSWIRDGAFTATALLEFAHPEEVRDFLRWYAAHQLPDGRVPCCIDQRGPDRTPEHDSDGELIFAVAEYYRFTRDVGLVWELWPTVVRAVEHLDRQRHERLGEEWERGEKRAFRGLLPESISHEGYSARPVHSYWDDFFALRGFRDAADLAVVVGDEERTPRFAALRDAFRTDLHASLARTMERHGIDFLPGSVELGDFDPTSTSAAISPGGELAHLPRAAVERTFDRYLEHVRERAGRRSADEGYTPYELRNVDALIHLGRREDAFELLRRMLADQRPAPWHQWAEVVWLDPGSARFVGDMPHTWVGSSFLRAVRALFAYEREADRALVLGAGLPAHWLAGDAPVGVKRLPTHHGVLSYRLQREAPGRLRWTLWGDLDVPPGGIVLAPPLEAPLAAVTVGGRAADGFSRDAVTLRSLPADVVLEWAAPGAAAADG